MYVVPPLSDIAPSSSSRDSGTRIPDSTFIHSTLSVHTDPTLYCISRVPTCWKRKRTNKEIKSTNAQGDFFVVDIAWCRLYMYHVSYNKSNNRGEKEEIRWIVNEEIEERTRPESRFIEHHYCRLTIGAGTSTRRPKASAYRAEAGCCFGNVVFFRNGCKRCVISII